MLLVYSFRVGFNSVCYIRKSLAKHRLGMKNTVKSDILFRTMYNGIFGGRRLIELYFTTKKKKIFYGCVLQGSQSHLFSLRLIYSIY